MAKAVMLKTARGYKLGAKGKVYPTRAEALSGRARRVRTEK